MSRELFKEHKRHVDHKRLHAVGALDECKHIIKSVILFATIFIL